MGEMADMYDYLTDCEDGEWGGRQPSRPVCKFCGSTDVRWRHNGGKWTLFSLTPGVLHVCPISDADFPDLSK